MKLEAEGQPAINDPQGSQIESAVTLLSLPDRNFVILSRSKASYIQAGIVGPNRIVLECRDGTDQEHFRSVRDDYSGGEVVAILEAYRRGDDLWWNEKDWRRIDVATGRDRWDGVSRFCMISAVVLMFDAIVAFKGRSRDAIFGLEAMDALAIACVALMASSIIDLRRFRTMGRRARFWAINAIGVGLFIVAIQLIEHLRTR